MKVIPGNAQHIGSCNEQQDAFAFTDIEDLAFVSKAGVLVTVADGMGGMTMGREASNIAVKTILDEYSRKPDSKSISDALHDAILQANYAVVKMAGEEGLEGDVGTTVVAGVIYNDELFWASVGDSRIYLYRDKQLIKLTTDHNFARELEEEVAKGNLTSEEAENHPERNALTSFLGISKLDEIDSNSQPFRLKKGDRIILCSDGLYGTLSDGEIAETVSGNPHTACERLVRKALAKEKTAQDNITVAILACANEKTLSLSRFPKPQSKVNKLIGVGIVGLVLVSISIALWLGIARYKQRIPHFGIEKKNAIPSTVRPDTSGTGKE